MYEIASWKSQAEACVEDLSLIKVGLQEEVQELDKTASDQIRLLSSHINQTSCTGEVRIQLQAPAQITLGTPALALINRKPKLPYF